MTTALCLSCGSLKFGAICPCPECEVATTGNMNLDILFSDHHMTPRLLERFGDVVKTIRDATPQEDRRFWAFIAWLASNNPETLTITLPEGQLRDAVPVLLGALDLPALLLPTP